MATTIDELQVLITAQNKQFQKALREVSAQLDGVSGDTKKASSTMSAGFNKLGSIAKKTLVGGVVAGVAAITASIPSAVRRIDTLNNSARTFENMGFKTKDAEKAMEALNDSIMGLPTPLDSAVRGMTSLAATYGDVKLGQEVFTSLNNAILGFGGSAADVDNAIQQLSQLPMDGPLDAQTWNSLRNSGLTPLLVAMAKDSKMSVSEMKEAFGEGELKVEDFIQKLLKMNKEGGGGLKSLEIIAKDSTKGIGTSFANLKTALTRSVANIIAALGPENFSDAINGMATLVGDIGKKIVAEIPKIRENVQKAMAKVFEFKDLIAGGNLNEAGRQLGTAIGTGIAEAIKLLRISMDVIKDWFGSIDWGQVGMAVGAGALAFVAGLVVGLFSTESLMQFVGFIADNWVEILLIVASIAFAPARLLGPIGNLFSKVISKIPFGNMFTQAFGKIVQAIRGFVEPIRSAFHSAVVAPITGSTNAMVGVLRSILGAIKDILLQPFRLAVAAVADVIKQIPVFATVAVNMVKSVFAPIANWFRGIFGQVAEAVASAFGRFSGPAANAWAGIRGAFSGVAGWFRGVFQSAWNNVTSIFGRIGSWFSSKAGEMRSAGADMIRGLVNGLNPGPVIERMKSIASSAIDTVKSFLGIKSPSRVMAQIGRQMNQGWSKGLDGSSSMAVNSAEKTAGQVLGRFSRLNTTLPSLDSNVRVPGGLPSISGRQTPVNVQLDGNTLLSFVIDGVNNRAFVTNSPTINF